MLLFACGSRSISSTLRPRMASAAARFTAVVVLPTPPFWFAMATIKSAVLLRQPADGRVPWTLASGEQWVMSAVL